MGGFKAPRTVYKLVFEDDEMEGLVVRARAMTLGEQEEYATLKYNRQIADYFAPYLVEWNLTDDDGNPVEATREGLDTCETPFLAKIVDAWQLAGIRVAAPLAKPSRDGEQLLEESIPMEVSSPSLAS
ncbi:MAG: hypothetical protein JWQ81_8521 [Amycolatopsis sp.]|jgi:hypothetical protein|uniref:hypothetical protein n=1 Tax=Amycolatopsis sp. TaxID=37632 RepID=UPI00260383BE|nr:hypothetical protein [Amycolatopsis sp.]MCU1687782.1 hypothetical protein [Amycolatopsis sp.]